MSLSKVFDLWLTPCLPQTHTGSLLRPFNHPQKRPIKETYTHGKRPIYTYKQRAMSYTLLGPDTQRLTIWAFQSPPKETYKRDLYTWKDYIWMKSELCLTTYLPQTQKGSLVAPYDGSYVLWVATISRLLKIIGLFCRISSLFIGLFCKRDL